MMPAAPRPLKIRMDGSSIVLRSLDDAIGFVRSHPVREHAEMLLDQMESAHMPNLRRRAWVAFETFADAMKLTSDMPAGRCGTQLM